MSDSYGYWSNTATIQTPNQITCYQGYTPSHTIPYSCITSVDYNGNPNLIYNPSIPRPWCIPIPCPQLPTTVPGSYWLYSSTLGMLENGTAGTGYGATLVCPPGYSVSYNTRKYCNRDETWSNWDWPYTDPVCSPTTCANLYDPYGTWTTNVVLGSSAYLTCYAGYTLAIPGLNSLDCIVSNDPASAARFNPLQPIPRCVQMSCSVLPNVPYGQWLYADGRTSTYAFYNQYAYLYCDYGFSPSNSRINCNYNNAYNNASWDSDPTTFHCIPQACSQLYDDNGMYDLHMPEDTGNMAR